MGATLVRFVVSGKPGGAAQTVSAPEAQLTPNLAVLTLDAASELVPTRAAASIFGDAVQLNSRNVGFAALSLEPAAASVLGA